MDVKYIKFLTLIMSRFSFQTFQEKMYFFKYD